MKKGTFYVEEKNAKNGWIVEVNGYLFGVSLMDDTFFRVAATKYKITDIKTGRYFCGCDSLASAKQEIIKNFGKFLSATNTEIYQKMVDAFNCNAIPNDALN